MDSVNAIEVKNVTKSFKVYLDKGNTIKEKIVSSKRRKYENRQVLKGISFNIKRGEAVGLIGHNGCGKSTTLKLLTKIMYPDSGSIDIRGRVSSLIELGAGFHPDMSGRENIYINASIFGLSKKEIRQRMDDIIGFSELQDYIDNPVRTYSSGMYMRLAFSIAINVDADVLLIDEILAVGDANFQAKCFDKLREIKKKGTTIVIVSHSLSQIEQIGDRSIWLNDGTICADGLPREVHPQYMDYMGEVRQQQKDKEEKGSQAKEKETAEEKNEAATPSEQIDKEPGETGDSNSEKTEEIKRWGSGKAQITGVQTFDKDGKKKQIFRIGDTIIFRLDYKLQEVIEEAGFGIGIYRNDGTCCYGVNTTIDHIEGIRLENDGSMNIVLEEVYLLPGTYSIDLAIECDKGISLDYVKGAYEINIYADTNEEIGITRIKHRWLVNGI